MKLLSYLSRMLMTAVFVAVVSVMTTWLIVDTYVERILERFHLQDVYASVQPQHMWEHMIGLIHPKNAKDLAGTEDTLGKSGFSSQGEKKPDSAMETNAPVAGTTDSGNETGAKENAANYGETNEYDGQDQQDDADSSENDTPAEAEPDALPVWGQFRAQSQQEQSVTQRVEQESSDSLLITTEQLNRIKEEMNDDDKMKIFSLVVPKISQEEWFKLSQLLEDGLTAEELSEVHAMIDRHLTEEEWKELMSILDRY